MGNLAFLAIKIKYRQYTGKSPNHPDSNGIKLKK